MTQDDKALVQALHRGERYACDDLVERYASRIYNVALRLTGHPTEAEEILQETLINACNATDTFEGRSSLDTWLYRIATNNGLMRLRQKKAATVPLDDGTEARDADFWPQQLADWDWNPEAVTLNAELREVMDQAVADLPDVLRATFVLRDLEGLSTKETAAALDISTSNVKVRLYRARLMLREALTRYFSERQSVQEAEANG